MTVAIEGGQLASVQSRASRRHPADIAVLDGETSGWQVCLGRNPGRLVRLIKAAQRLRLVVGEPLLDDSSAPHIWQVFDQVHTLLDASPGEVVDRVADGPVPWLSITIADLRPDGNVTVACKYAPSVLHVRSSGSIGLLPGASGPDHAGAWLDEGDHLVAYSASCLGSLAPQTLADLPHLGHAHTGPCGLWEDLMASRASSSSADQGTPADLVVITRSTGGWRG